MLPKESALHFLRSFSPFLRDLRAALWYRNDLPLLVERTELLKAAQPGQPPTLGGFSMRPKSHIRRAPVREEFISWGGRFLSSGSRSSVSSRIPAALARERVLGIDPAIGVSTARSSHALLVGRELAITWITPLTPLQTVLLGYHPRMPG